MRSALLFSSARAAFESDDLKATLARRLRRRLLALAGAAHGDDGDGDWPSSKVRRCVLSLTNERTNHAFDVISRQEVFSGGAVTRHILMRCFLRRTLRRSKEEEEKTFPSFFLAPGTARRRLSRPSRSRG